LREESFLGFELAGVYTAANTSHLDRMLEVKHFVVKQVFDSVPGT
jgi:hypothetical protein